jgi:thioredoxin
LVCFEGIVKFEELKSNDMKAKYLIAAAASLMIALATSCGNAGAQNDNNKKTTGPKHAIELTSEQFSQLVYDIDGDDMKYLGSKPAIVDFTASWCGPCQRIAPILEELAAEYKGKIVIYKVDIDKERGLAEAFNVSSIPAVLYIPTGADEPIMTIGARGKEKFVEEINKFLIQK